MILFLWGSYPSSWNTSSVLEAPPTELTYYFWWGCCPSSGKTSSIFEAPPTEWIYFWWWWVLLLFREYIQHIISPTDRVSLFLVGGLTNRQRIQTAYSTPRQQSESIFGGVISTLQGIQTAYSMPRWQSVSIFWWGSYSSSGDIQHILSLTNRMIS